MTADDVLCFAKGNIVQGISHLVLRVLRQVTHVGNVRALSEPTCQTSSQQSVIVTKQVILSNQLVVSYFQRLVKTGKEFSHNSGTKSIKYNRFLSYITGK